MLPTILLKKKRKLSAILTNFPKNPTDIYHRKLLLFHAHFFKNAQQHTTVSEKKIKVIEYKCKVNHTKWSLSLSDLEKLYNKIFFNFPKIIHHSILFSFHNNIRKL